MYDDSSSSLEPPPKPGTDEDPKTNGRLSSEETHWLEFPRTWPLAGPVDRDYRLVVAGNVTQHAPLEQQQQESQWEFLELFRVVPSLAVEARKRKAA
ncbi:uncharacterized protein PG986_008498 [Apiospora aurea]|uniref:Uncharacterized protein n=1 Tax=Apiospora aurea TaxID=335848 RepID=A0ABR1QH15_9PEZI